MNGDIYVEPSVTLTIGIDGELRMCQNARIIVKRGGRLLVGGIIKGRSNPTPCVGDFSWRGIEVWGFSTLAHPDITAVGGLNYPSGDILEAVNQHGVVWIRAGGTIKHAEIGVTTKQQFFNPVSQLWEQDLDFTGGIVVGATATFEDNGIAVQFMPFTASDNISFFRNCTFTYAEFYAFNCIGPLS